MALNYTYLSSAAVGLSLMASTASADLTAADVWGDWRGHLEGLGYAVTAIQSTDGSKLSVSDIEIQTSDGPNIRSMVMRIGGMEFVENAGGSVAVVMAERMPMAIIIAPDDNAPSIEMNIEYAQSGHQMTVRGDAGAMTYDYSADTFGLILASLVMDGKTMDATTAQFGMEGTALVSKTAVTVGETRDYEQSVQIGSLSYDMLFNAPDNVEGMVVRSKLGAMSFTGNSTVPADQLTQTSDLMPLIAAGFAFDGTFDTQGTETEVELTSEDGTTKIKTGSARSTLGVAMGADGIRYDVDAQQVQIGAQLAGLPFPLFAEMANSGFNLQSPVAQSETPQDFKIAFNLTDFTMSDIIWALFDPSQQLPRDPATIALGISGKAKVLLDPFDPETIQRSAKAGTYPGELDSLRIDTLIVDAVGAKVEAQGDVMFDNTDTTTLPGFPKPVGDVTINVTGANGLMDKLVAMGLLPAEQVMGARMMLGLFAVPGDAPDTLKSRIEFNEAGQILANGQHIK